MKTFLAISSVVILAGLALSGAFAAPDEPAAPACNKEPSDVESRRDFMRTKLMYSQNILEGLTTNDFAEIEHAVKELQKVTQGEKWLSVEDEDYAEHTADFEKSTKRLLEAAKTSNIEATALRFHEMSLRCIDCHKHVRKLGVRI